MRRIFYVFSIWLIESDNLICVSVVSLFCDTLLWLNYMVQIQLYKDVVGKGRRIAL